MTQVKEMTNTELNRKLAELMGFTEERYEGFVRVLRNGEVVCAWLPDEGYTNAFMPDYCSSPAASLEVQAAAIKIDARLYAINLAKRLTWEGDGDSLGYGDKDLFSYTGVSNFLLASPRERAEAAWMTLCGEQ